MEFVEDLEQLESMFEEHKVDNHEIQDFRQNVDECIARQVDISVIMQFVDQIEVTSKFRSSSLFSSLMD